MTKLSTFLAASAAAGALALTGCGNSEEEPQIEEGQQQSTKQAEDSTTESADDAAADEKGGSLEAAHAAIDLADKEDVDALKKAKTSLKDALKNAIDEQAGTIDEADLDTDGKPTWSVEIYPEGKTDSVDIYVSAMNGEIVDEPADD